jgi:transposase InsO family protein
VGRSIHEKHGSPRNSDVRVELKKIECLYTCNGIMERWIRTLKEECLYLHDFESLEEAREIIGEFIRRYNEQWMLERFEYRSPLEIRSRSLRWPRE